MDAISIFRGYGKVDPRENQTSDRRSSQRSLLTTIAITVVILLTLVIGSILAAAVIREYGEEETESPSLSADSLESIRSVCSVTQYPNSCFTAISSLNTSAKPDPEFIFKISLSAAIAELSNLSSSINTLLNDGNSDPALQDCATQLDDALGRLNESMSAMEARPGEKMLTESKINDIQTWVSAAMTDQDTCFDGLEEMGSKVLNQVNHSKRQRSKEYMSNSLAIVAKMPLLLEKFGLKMH